MPSAPCGLETVSRRAHPGSGPGRGLSKGPGGGGLWPGKLGKTTLNLHAIAEAQRRRRGWRLSSTPNNALDSCLCAALGVGTLKNLLGSPAGIRGEMALEILLIKLFRLPPVDSVVSTRVAALTPGLKIGGGNG